MPVFRIKAPNGKTYPVEAPPGATEEDARKALFYYVPEAATPPALKTGVLAQAKAGFERTVSGLQTGLEGAVGDAAQAAQRGIEREQDIGSRYAQEVSLDKLKEAYAERGLTGAAGELLSQVPKAVAGQAANIGASLAGAKAGALAGGRAGALLGLKGAGVGALVGGGLGAFVPSALQLFGENIQTQQQETPGQVEKLPAAAAAGAGAALEVGALGVALGRRLLTSVLGEPFEQLVGKLGAEAAEKLARQGLLRAAASGTLRTAAAEIPTEVVQSALTRAQAGLPLGDEEAMKGYGEAAYQAALISPIGAPGRVTEVGSARAKREEERRQQELADRARAAQEAQAAAAAQKAEQEAAQGMIAPPGKERGAQGTLMPAEPAGAAPEVLAEGAAQATAAQQAQAERQAQEQRAELEAALQRLRGTTPTGEDGQLVAAQQRMAAAARAGNLEEFERSRGLLQQLSKQARQIEQQLAKMPGAAPRVAPLRTPEERMRAQAALEQLQTTIAELSQEPEANYQKLRRALAQAQQLRQQIENFQPGPEDLFAAADRRDEEAGAQYLREMEDVTAGLQPRPATPEPDGYTQAVLEDLDEREQARREQEAQEQRAYEAQRPQRLDAAFNQAFAPERFAAMEVLEQGPLVQPPQVESAGPAVQGPQGAYSVPSYINEEFLRKGVPPQDREARMERTLKQLSGDVIKRASQRLQAMREARDPRSKELLPLLLELRRINVEQGGKGVQRAEFVDIAERDLGLRILPEGPQFSNLQDQQAVAARERNFQPAFMTRREQQPITGFDEEPLPPAGEPEPQLPLFGPGLTPEEIRRAGGVQQAQAQRLRTEPPDVPRLMRIRGELRRALARRDLQPGSRQAIEQVDRTIQELVETRANVPEPVLETAEEVLRELMLGRGTQREKPLAPRGQPETREAAPTQADVFDDTGITNARKSRATIVRAVLRQKPIDAGPVGETESRKTVETTAVSVRPGDTTTVPGKTSAERVRARVERTLTQMQARFKRAPLSLEERGQLGEDIDLLISEAKKAVQLLPKDVDFVGGSEQLSLFKNDTLATLRANPRTFQRLVDSMRGKLVQRLEKRDFDKDRRAIEAALATPTAQELTRLQEADLAVEQAQATLDTAASQVIEVTKLVSTYGGLPALRKDVAALNRVKEVHARAVDNYKALQDAARGMLPPGTLSDATPKTTRLELDRALRQIEQELLAYRTAAGDKTPLPELKPFASAKERNSRMQALRAALDVLETERKAKRPTYTDDMLAAGAKHALIARELVYDTLVRRTQRGIDAQLDALEGGIRLLEQQLTRGAPAAQLAKDFDSLENYLDAQRANVERAEFKLEQAELDSLYRRTFAEEEAQMYAKALADTKAAEELEAKRKEMAELSKTLSTLSEGMAQNQRALEQRLRQNARLQQADLGLDAEQVQEVQAMLDRARSAMNEMSFVRTDLLREQDALRDWSSAVSDAALRGARVNFSDIAERLAKADEFEQQARAVEAESERLKAQIELSRLTIEAAQLTQRVAAAGQVAELVEAQQQRRDELLKRRGELVATIMSLETRVGLQRAARELYARTFAPPTTVKRGAAGADGSRARAQALAAARGRARKDFLQSGGESVRVFEQLTSAQRIAREGEKAPELLAQELRAEMLTSEAAEEARDLGTKDAALENILAKVLKLPTAQQIRTVRTNIDKAEAQLLDRLSKQRSQTIYSREYLSSPTYADEAALRASIEQLNDAYRQAASAQDRAKILEELAAADRRLMDIVNESTLSQFAGVTPARRQKFVLGIKAYQKKLADFAFERAALDKRLELMGLNEYDAERAAQPVQADRGSPWAVLESYKQTMPATKVGVDGAPVTRSDVKKATKPQKTRYSSKGVFKTSNQELGADTKKLFPKDVLNTQIAQVESELETANKELRRAKNAQVAAAAQAKKYPTSKRLETAAKNARLKREGIEQRIEALETRREELVTQGIAPADNVDMLRAEGSGAELTPRTSQALQNNRLVDALAGVAGDPFSQRVARTIAPLLGNVQVKLVDKMPGGVPDAPGGISADGTRMQINQRTGMDESTLLHEAVHAATLEQLGKPDAQLTAEQRAAKQELQALHKMVQENPEIDNAVAKDPDLREFVAEALGSRALAAQLAAIPAPRPKTSMWQAFKDAILRLLGVKTPPAGNVRDRVLELAEKFMAPPVARASDVKAEVAHLRAATDSGAADPLSRLGRALTTERPKGVHGWLKDPNKALAAEMAIVDMRAPVLRALSQGEQKLYDMASYFVRKADARMGQVYAVLSQGALKLVREPGGNMHVEAGNSVSAMDIFDAIRAVPGATEQDKILKTQAYLVARRATNKGWDKLGFEVAPALRALGDEVVKQVDADPKLKQALDAVQALYADYNRGQIEFLADSGAISRKLAAELLKDRDYVPFYRVGAGGAAELVLNEQVQLRVGDLKNQPYLQQLKGDDQKLLPLPEAIMRNTMLLTDLALGNLARRNVAYALQEMGKGMGPPGKDGQPTNLNVIKKARNSSKVPDGANILKFKQEPDPNDADDSGDRFIEVELAGTAAADVPVELFMRSLEGTQLVMPTFLKLFATASDWLRAGITRNPAYVIRQLIRDPFAAAFTAGADRGPVRATLKALQEFAGTYSGKTENMQLLVRKGIVQSGIFTGDPDDLNKFALQVVRGDQSAITKLAAMADQAAMRADAAARAQVYEDMLKKTGSPMRAEMAAMELMNFTKRGASPSVQYMARMIPFFNAQIQGLNVLYKAATGKADAQQALDVRRKFWNRATTLMAFSTLYALAMEDDKEYKNASPQDRYSNFFMPLPNGVTLALPIPYEVGLLFKALPEAMVDVMRGDFEADEWKGLRSAMLNTIPGASNWGMPQLIKPVLETATNKNFFTGREIERADQRDLRFTERYNVTTTEAAKRISELLDSGLVPDALKLSPVQIEHLVRGYLGGLPVAGMALMNELFAVPNMPGVDVPQPERRLRELPVLGSLVRDEYGYGAIASAYAKFNAVEEAAKTFDKLKKEGRVAAAQEFRERNLDVLAAEQIAQRFFSDMRKLREIEARVRQSTMPSERKREELDKLTKRQQDVASQYEQAVRAIPAS